MSTMHMYNPFHQHKPTNLMINDTPVMSAHYETKPQVFSEEAWTPGNVRYQMMYTVKIQSYEPATRFQMMWDRQRNGRAIQTATLPVVPTVRTGSLVRPGGSQQYPWLNPWG